MSCKTLPHKIESERHKMTEPYYYNQLNKPAQNAYRAILAGLQELAPAFPAPLLDGRELREIYFCLRLDHPEIFYSETFKYRYVQGAECVQLMPEYLFDKKKITDHRKAMRARVEKLARPAREQKEMDKLLYIHDLICRSVRYDKLKKAYSHEIIGPLGQGVGVCEGIAKSVKILCDALDLWCVTAICGNNPEKGIRYRHTWNIVQVGGKKYHVDVTFDNSLGTPEEIRYDYFMLSDRQIFRDHEPVIYRMPDCSDGEHFYYRENKLSFTRKEDVQKRAAQAARKGRPFTFHWRGGYLTREVLTELLQILEEEAVKKERHAKVSLNWPQAVIRVTFEKEAPSEPLVMEEANEGEQAGEDIRAGAGEQAGEGRRAGVGEQAEGTEAYEKDV